MTALKKLIPFLNEDDLKDLLNKVLSSIDEIYQDIKLKDLLPFLNDENIDNLFVERLRENKDIDSFLPFVSKQTLKNIVELYCNDRLNYEIDILKLKLYLDEDEISKIYKKLTKEI